jgi:hypothetical protein
MKNEVYVITENVITSSLQLLLRYNTSVSDIRVLALLFALQIVTEIMCFVYMLVSVGMPIIAAAENRQSRFMCFSKHTKREPRQGTVQVSRRMLDREYGVFNELLHLIVSAVTNEVEIIAASAKVGNTVSGNKLMHGLRQR